MTTLLMNRQLGMQAGMLAGGGPAATDGARCLQVVGRRQEQPGAAHLEDVQAQSPPEQVSGGEGFGGLGVVPSLGSSWQGLPPSTEPRHFLPAPQACLYPPRQ